MQLIGFCRQGFETELAEEFKAKGMQADAISHQALAVAPLDHVTDRSLRQIRLNDYIFARELFVTSGPISELSEADRASPIINVLGMQLVELGLELLFKDVVVTY